MNPVMQFCSNILAKYLTKTVANYKPFSVHRWSILESVMQPGDVLLVEGDHRISSAIKYLTQSTWSHAAFYVGDITKYGGTAPESGEENENTYLIEADLETGVIAVPLSKYTRYNIRICRPVNLTDEDLTRLCTFMVDGMGMEYDLKNIVDLARYLLPQPPVPRRWRRRMLALGSGDPTRAVCSSLIAQAFQSIKYPILPDRLSCAVDDSMAREILHIRHHSLFTPRDFDVSPYFEVIKPELAMNFDYQSIDWQQHTAQFTQTGIPELDAGSCEVNPTKRL
ncbi:hypothetical protein AB833_18830 [Chromatiales bacterium (ex Bugula neritina AB1)]|nr:hypothetical protein AB833_18830 [Chromatiales bacterium (ex Bugula neritina AB1)]